MEKKQTTLGSQCDRYDWVPAVLRNVSGFNACITVVVTSLIFVMTIHTAVTATPIGWFNSAEIAIMMAGPVIIAWNFVNVNSTLESVIKSTDDNQETPTEHLTRKLFPKGYITEADSATEREIFGLSTMMMRAFVGFTSAHAICFGSLVYTWTIRQAVLGGKALPGEFEILLAVIGPIVTSWHFVRAANTINILISGGAAFMNLRQWLSEFIAPKPK